MTNSSCVSFVRLNILYNNKIKAHGTEFLCKAEKKDSQENTKQQQQTLQFMKLIAANDDVVGFAVSFFLPPSFS